MRKACTSSRKCASRSRGGVMQGAWCGCRGPLRREVYDEGQVFDISHRIQSAALLVNVPCHRNITVEAMKSLHIPIGVKRVLFRTLNTARRLMWKKEFDKCYPPFASPWSAPVDNTDIKLVGVDYLSAAAYDDLIPSHHAFLEGREIILVEGLKLDNIEAGAHTVNCLPLRLVGAERSALRCILVK
ncbi:cyclase-like protein 2 [Daucus carota subsp. sativus]|uniref:cyclase-like protein 2 n=1 Tax=Daucus carota subsp. sativus TaxID=79200 RepID=UPI003082C684